MLQSPERNEGSHCGDLAGESREQGTACEKLREEKGKASRELRREEIRLNSCSKGSDGRVVLRVIAGQA